MWDGIREFESSKLPQRSESQCSADGGEKGREGHRLKAFSVCQNEADEDTGVLRPILSAHSARPMPSNKPGKQTLKQMIARV